MNLYDLKKQEEIDNPLMGKTKKDKDKKEVRDNWHIYEGYKNGDRDEWELGARADNSFFNGIMWDEEAAREVKRNKQNPFSINETKPGIELLISQLTANRPRFITQPVEDSDVDISDKISKVLERVWYISKGNVKLKTAIR